MYCSAVQRGQAVWRGEEGLLRPLSSVGRASEKLLACDSKQAVPTAVSGPCLAIYLSKKHDHSSLLRVRVYGALCILNINIIHTHAIIQPCYYRVTHAAPMNHKRFHGSDAFAIGSFHQALSIRRCCFLLLAVQIIRFDKF